MDTKTLRNEPWFAGMFVVMFTLCCILLSIRNLTSDAPVVVAVSDHTQATQVLSQTTEGTSLQIVTPKSPVFDIKLPVQGDAETAIWLMAQLRSDLNVDIDGKTRILSAIGHPQISLLPIGTVILTGSSELALSGLGGQPPSLAVIVLAPPAMSPETVTGYVLKGDPSAGSDIGMILLVLLAAGFCLAMISKSDLSANLKSSSVILVLAGIVVFAASHFAQPDPSPLQPAEDKRQGVERAIDDLLDKSLAGISNGLINVLPNQVSYDDVPERLLDIRGNISVSVYQADHAADYPLVSKTFLGGLITHIQELSWPEFRNIVAFMSLTLLVTWLIPFVWPQGWQTPLFLALASALSLMMTYRIAYGWDEFFVNLRHAWMLLEHGTYSINPDVITEASVDLLPLIITAILGWFGVPLPSAFLMISGLGNILVTVFGYLIAKSMTGSRPFALLVAVIVGCYPNILWIGGTGFTAGTFTGAMIAATYFLLFSERRVIGLVILASLTLIRTEGVLFAALVMSYTHILAPRLDTNETWGETIRRAFVEGSLVASPFLLSAVTRWSVYGELVPTPMTFKNTLGDISYAQHGIARLFETISLHDLHIVFLVIVVLGVMLLFTYAKDSTAARHIRHALALSVISILFIVPYFIGGGDWFPNSWNRYGQIATVMTLLMVLCLIFRATHDLTGKYPRPVYQVYLALGLVVFIAVYIQETKYRPKAMYRITYDHLVQPYEHFWTRVDQLAGLGLFLKEYLPEDAVVASPEESTIMYYSEHKMLGLLGISTPSIATRELQPMYPGSVVHRKRGHEAVFEFRPDVIAIKEPFWFDEHKTWSQIEHSIKTEMLSPLNTDVGYISLGSFRALQVMGYEYMAVAYEDRIYAFFVHERIRSTLHNTLTSGGFNQIESVGVDYRVDPYLTERYLPGVPQLLDQL